MSYTLLDVCKIRRYLLKKVPPELAALILEHGEFWIGRMNEARFQDFTSIRATWAMETPSCSEYTFITHPIPHITLGGETVRTKVRRVRFTLESRDQGWSSFPSSRGTYNESGSWFEAGIIKPGIEDIPLNKAETTSTFEASAFDLTGGLELRNPLGPFRRSFTQNPDEKFHRWFLQANVHASKTLKAHVIEWNYDDRDFPNDITKVPGTGHGKGFISALKADHRICVVSRVETPLWENRIHYVKVEVFFTF